MGSSGDVYSQRITPLHLAESISALLDRAAAATTDDGVRARLAEARSRLHGPLRLAIAGRRSTNV